MVFFKRVKAKITTWWRHHVLLDRDKANLRDSMVVLQGSSSALMPNEDDDAVDCIALSDLMTPTNAPRPLIHPIFESLNRILTTPSIANVLFDSCSIVTLVQLLKTSHRLRNAVKAYIAQVFTVDRIISRYFEDPLSFRSMQAHTATIISGSAALQFFDRSFHPSSDLDLYVPSLGARKLTHFILENGYTFVPHLGQKSALKDALEESTIPLWMEDQYSTTRGIAGVFGFTKISNGDELTIQVIVAFHATLDIVLRCHSTCVMNIITYNRAYCLYPRTTLEDRVSLLCTDRSDPIIQRYFLRYSQRGWTMSLCSAALPLSTLHSLWINRPRSMTGSFTWTVRLPDPPVSTFYINERSAVLRFDPVSAASWTLLVNDAGRCMMQFKLIRSAHLCHTYVRHDETVLHDPFFHTLGRANITEPRFIDQTFIELCRMYDSVDF